jgi:hypothetical protein
MLRRILPECSSAGNFVVLHGSNLEIPRTHFEHSAPEIPSFNPQHTLRPAGENARQNVSQSLFY